MKTKKNLPLVLAAVVCILALLAMVLALTLNGKNTDSSFTPPPFDENAQVGTPEVPEGLGWGELDAQVFKASVCGVFNPDGSTADIWLTSPESNNVWLKLRVLDAEGNILGETGLIKPGEYVRSVSLSSTPKSGAKITLKLMAYEPETYHSAGAASLNTVIR